VRNKKNALHVRDVCLCSLCWKIQKNFEKATFFLE